ncbi:MAG: hypothetical protein GY798_22795, partial [Hyphomicrobiales bacterium]|nr:hypothetical protein [Hyphomicrobiales bacterium]
MAQRAHRQARCKKSKLNYGKMKSKKWGILFCIPRTNVSEPETDIEIEKSGVVLIETIKFDVDREQPKVEIFEDSLRLQSSHANIYAEVPLKEISRMEVRELHKSQWKSQKSYELTIHSSGVCVEIAASGGNANWLISLLDHLRSEGFLKNCKCKYIRSAKVNEFLLKGCIALTSIFVLL